MTSAVSLKKNQQGMASILVTMILMMIISLIVLGLARLSRREQRQVLDDQLSTQAFYAAESGVNDAVNEIKTGTVDLSQDYSSNCSTFINARSLQTKSQLNGSLAQYTCLLVNAHPDNLKFDRVSRNKSTVAQLIPDPNLNPPGTALINTLKVSWQDADGDTTVTGCRTDTKLPQLEGSTTWPSDCKTGILRIDLVNWDVNNSGSYDRARLAQRTLTLFLYPQPSGSGQTSFDIGTVLPVTSSNNGVLIPVKCDGTGPRQCTVSLDGLNSDTDAAIRMKSIYRDSAVTLSAEYSSGTPLKLDGGQVVIDATGKANDVLRRIQVRVEPKSNLTYPEFAIQSGDTICKQLLIAQADGSASTAQNGVEACRILNL